MVSNQHTEELGSKLKQSTRSIDNLGADYGIGGAGVNNEAERLKLTVKESNTVSGIEGVGVNNGDARFKLAMKDGNIVSDSGKSKTYYVSLKGNNDNPGTIEQPLRTISHCISLLTSGGSCIIRGGRYTENKIKLFNIKGKVSNNIIIAS